jgi:UV DNA damage endonuclease
MKDQIRYGYACINMQLSKQGIRTGRTMIDRKFREGGMQLASDISLANAKDLLTILKWNEQNGIRLFRIGSELFPRWNHYRLEDLPGIDEITHHLRAAGDFARQHGHRLTTHPGPFHILGSPKQDVVDNSIIGLERHSEMFDLMGYDPSYENKINIHIGSAYGDKASTINRWLSNYNTLSDRLRARLVLENDDKASLYSVRDLYEMVHMQTGIPITFDYWHHTFNTGDITEQEAFFMARSTWEKHGVTQCTHYSESRRREQQLLIEKMFDHHGISLDTIEQWPTFHKQYKEFSKIKEQAHADYITATPNTYGVGDLDIVVEAKAKELSWKSLGIECVQNTSILVD